MSITIKTGLTIALLAAAVPAAVFANDPEPATGEHEQGAEVAVFRSDIAMGRIDVQVLDPALRAVANLTEDDFLLRRDDETVPIRDFSYQELPVDVVLLLDVSGSMRPQVERVASAADRALRVLSDKDRVAIMTFTTRARVRMKFAEDREEIERRLDDVVRQTSFVGGTDINRALLDTAEYIVKEGRRDARHAIIIVTDDVARPIDQQKVGMALSEADAVLMALVTPAALQFGSGPAGYPGGGYPGGRYPGGYPPVMLPPWPGGRGGVWGTPVPRRRPGGAPAPEDAPRAGTSDVARESGGDGFPSSDATSLEAAFTRIREQYSMYFYLPDGATADDAAAIVVDLANNTRIRHPDVELRYRQVYLAGNARRTLVKRVRPGPPSGGVSAPETLSAPTLARGGSRPTTERTGTRVEVTPRKPVEVAATGDSSQETADSPRRRRRPAVSEPGGPRVGPIP
ncbi:MAG: VWA domain-containing protein [Bryobacteraceae bacterium]|nr:VWA domain-containing protein [Bryobacteraceae bacterium]